MKGMKCDGCECMVFRRDIPFTALQPALVFFNQAPLGERVEKIYTLQCTQKNDKKGTLMAYCML